MACKVSLSKYRRIASRKRAIAAQHRRIERHAACWGGTALRFGGFGK